MRALLPASLLLAIGLFAALSWLVTTCEVYWTLGSEADWVLRKESWTSPTGAGAELTHEHVPSEEAVRRAPEGSDITAVIRTNSVLPLEYATYDISRAGRSIEHFTVGRIRYFGVLGGISLTPIVAALLVVLATSKRPGAPGRSASSSA